jgi:hypothetical protein
MRVSRGGPAGALAMLGLLGAGCASPRFTLERQAGGAERIRCRVPLGECLGEVERHCDGGRYVVLRAVDEHDRRGGRGLNLGVRTSEALFRCGPELGWPLGFDPMMSPPEAAACPATPPAPAPPPPAEPPPPPPVRACFPGSTQACVGPSGCHGGQACLPDAAAFGPCDCGADATGVSRPR